MLLRFMFGKFGLPEYLLLATCPVNNFSCKYIQTLRACFFHVINFFFIVFFLHISTHDLNITWQKSHMNSVEHSGFFNFLDKGCSEPFYL